MKLPVEITPNPLISSRIEIRYISNIPFDDILGVLYPAFSTVFPTLKKNTNKSENQSKSAPDFMLVNDEYAFIVSDNIIAFEIMGDYSFWKNYFPFVCEQLNVLQGLSIVNTIQRVGVRYISLFEKEVLLAKNFVTVPRFNLEGYRETPQTYRTIINPSDELDIQINVQIAKNARATRDDETRLGSLIDIEAFRDLNEIKLSEEVFNIIDLLHSQEKKVFFSLLDSTFLASLNPKYD